jgi:hypothetical protein
MIGGHCHLSERKVLGEFDVFVHCYCHCRLIFKFWKLSTVNGSSAI